ncbi:MULTISPECIES: hypothetical protein [unclassified Lentimonas]|uniref:hypothetical protein n=1 Tax=unclassified Lentimonas TaxID=2630993 RepID=UPI001389E1FB|nr:MULTISPECIES: hypothetical protein [unclassified Lentimonas]
MELFYKLHWFRWKRQITIKCSDGQEYVCSHRQIDRCAFGIYQNENRIVHGESRNDGTWIVKDTKENKTLFTTTPHFGGFSINMNGLEVKEKDLLNEFGWKSLSCYGLTTWGIAFPEKEDYLAELAYGYLKLYWRTGD